MNRQCFVLLTCFNTCSNIKRELAPHIKGIFLSHCWTQLQNIFRAFSLKAVVKAWCKQRPLFASPRSSVCCHGATAVLTLEGVNRRGEEREQGGGV